MNKLMSEVLFNRAMIMMVGVLVTVEGGLADWLALVLAASAVANIVKSLRVWAGDAE